jgi:hypothetical protein
MRQIIHYFQLLFSGRFRNYDFKSDNMLHYNTTSPPDYDIENIVTPLHLYHGAADEMIGRKVSLEVVIKKKLLTFNRF